MTPDRTPVPYGTVTRLWTQLDADEQSRQAQRLLGIPLDTARIDRPDPSTEQQYLRLVLAARAHDEVAFAWLTTTHRPLLMHRGRALLATDPEEWGAVALELLHDTIHHIDLADGRWLRSRMTQRLHRLMSRHIRVQLRHAAHEAPTAPSVLLVQEQAFELIDADPHLDLSAAIATALGRLDDATRDGLQARVEERTVSSVAQYHDVSYETLRKRVYRARQRLRPELAAYHRTAA